MKVNAKANTCKSKRESEHACVPGGSKMLPPIFYFCYIRTSTFNLYSGHGAGPTGLAQLDRVQKFHRVFCSCTMVAITYGFPK